MTSDALTDAERKELAQLLVEGARVVLRQRRWRALCPHLVVEAGKPVCCCDFALHQAEFSA